MSGHGLASIAFFVATACRICLLHREKRPQRRTLGTPFHSVGLCVCLCYQCLISCSPCLHISSDVISVSIWQASCPEHKHCPICSNVSTPPTSHPPFCVTDICVGWPGPHLPPPFAGNVGERRTASLHPNADLRSHLSPTFHQLAVVSHDGALS